MKKEDVSTIIFLIVAIASWAFMIYAGWELYQLYTSPKPY